MSSIDSHCRLDEVTRTGLFSFFCWDFRLFNNSITEPWTCQDGIQSRSRFFIFFSFRCQIALNSHRQKLYIFFGNLRETQRRWSMLLPWPAQARPRRDPAGERIDDHHVKLWKWISSLSHSCMSVCESYPYRMIRKPTDPICNLLLLLSYTPSLDRNWISSAATAVVWRF